MRLAFDTSELPQKWFAAFTYMFAHVNVWHLAANMYGLFLFGPRLEQHLGARKFAWFYILCGLGGVVFQMLLIRTGTLVTLNKRYSALLKHSGETMRLFAGLFRCYSDMPEQGSGFRNNVHTWSCEL